MLSTNLRSSRERGCGNMIFSEDLAVDISLLMKLLSPP